MPINMESSPKKQKVSKSLKQEYAEMQIRKQLRNSKLNPVSVIAMLLDESRVEDRTRFAALISDAMNSMSALTGLSNRSCHRRLEKLGLNLHGKPREVQKNP